MQFLFSEEDGYREGLIALVVCCGDNHVDQTAGSHRQVAVLSKTPV